MDRGIQANNLFRGTLILTVAALITKILSAVYRIPFQNIVGDVGFYIYQQVYPLYGLALALSTYGFPVAISKLHIEYKSRDDETGLRKFIVVTGMYLLFIGIFLFLSIFLGADLIARQMNDPHLSILLKVVSFSFLLFPVNALLRGIFQGNGNMIPTAVSQVGEQLIRVAIILIASPLLILHGFSLYQIGAGAFFGSIAGGLVCVFILFFFWFRNKDFKIVNFKDIPSIIKFEDIRIIGKILLIQGLAVSISSLLLIFMQMADALNLYALLHHQGIDGQSAKILKGVYDRGQPLIQLGTVIATSMSLSLVPMITSGKLAVETEFLVEKIRLALKMSVCIGVGGTVGLIGIIRPTNMMLFENTDGSNVLSVLSLLILFGSIIMTLTAILQGLGNTIFPAIVVLAGFGIKLVLNQLLVPNYHTFGAAWASVITAVIIVFLLFYRLRGYFQSWSWNAKPFLHICFSAICMSIILYLYVNITNVFAGYAHERFIAAFQALSAVCIGGFAFLFIIIKLNVFKEKELYFLPFGSKLIWLLPNKHRRDTNE